MSGFKGFQSPNFTQIPNEYLDYTFSPECDLSKVQMQIMNFVFRETFGWQDKHKILVFSATDIMALLNIKKRKVITDALVGLVEEKKFLEAVEVTDLSKRVRSNIEKSLNRKLQPRQKIYRLNLIEGKKRPWDNVEEPHTDISERKAIFKSSYQTVTSDQTVSTSGYQTVTTTSDQMVTTLESENVGAVGTDDSLNKDLNKDLNKEEEEDVSVIIDQLLEAYKEHLGDSVTTVKIKLLLKAKDAQTNIKGYLISIIEDEISKQKKAPSQPKQQKKQVRSTSKRSEVTPERLEEIKNGKGTETKETPKIMDFEAQKAALEKELAEAYGK